MIQLRPLIPADAPTLAALCNNKKIWDNLRDFLPHPYTEADGDFFIHLTMQQDPKTDFGIVYQGELCGVIGLIPKKDIYRFTAELGYWLGEPFWGKGIATEAVRLMVDYGFQQLGFARLEAGVMAHNRGSMRVLEKNGFTLESIASKGIFKNDRFEDEYRYCRVGVGVGV